MSGTSLDGTAAFQFSTAGCIWTTFEAEPRSLFVSEQLEHASIVITLDRYSHLIAERHDDTVSKFEKLLLTN